MMPDNNHIHNCELKKIRREAREDAYNPDFDWVKRMHAALVAFTCSVELVKRGVERA